MKGPRLLLESFRSSSNRIINVGNCSENTESRRVELPIPRIDSKISNAGYFNLVNEHHVQQQRQRQHGHQQEDLLHSHLLTVPKEQDRNTLDNDESQDVTTSSTRSESHRSLSPQPQTRHQPQHQDQSVVTISETVRNIVNDDISWSQIRQKVKDAKVITSLGVHEACVGYVNDKREELRKAKEKRAKLFVERSSNLSKLRKRLSIFG